jgi:uncharacterized C2H2 Zn-finger protein
VLVLCCSHKWLLAFVRVRLRVKSVLEKEMLKCPECGASFESEEKLDKHVREKHPM